MKRSHSVSCDYGSTYGRMSKKLAINKYLITLGGTGDGCKMLLSTPTNIED